MRQVCLLKSWCFRSRQTVGVYMYSITVWLISSFYHCIIFLFAFIRFCNFSPTIDVRKHTVSVYQAFNGIYFIILQVSSVLQKISGTEVSRVLQWYTRGIDWSAVFCNSTCRSVWWSLEFLSQTKFSVKI